MSKRYALLYSSEEYDEAGKTPFCHADRELLTTTLTESCDYAPADVVSRALNRGDEGVVALIHEDLDNVKTRLKPGDTVLFFYAGHGMSLNNEPYLILPGTEAKNIEKTAIAIRDVSDQLRQDGVQCFRIFDSCHSGFDVRGTDMKAEPMMRGVVNRPADGWVTLAGCAPDEACYSSTDEGHGVFTSRLAKAIEEIEVDAEVRPEIIKVRTCELVSEWCADSGRQQTPTLIATVRGNVSIATRREVVGIMEEAGGDADPEEAEIDVKTRLTMLAGDAPPGSEEYWNRYKTAVEALRNALESKRGVVNKYGGELGAAIVSDVDPVLDSIKASVVDLVYKEGWRPLHHVKKEVETDASPFGSILAISALTSGYGKSHSITRELSQGFGTPDSTVRAEFKAEGAFPGLRIIHYVCPLQSRFLLYSRIEVLGVMSEERVKSHGWYRTVDTDNGELITEHACFVHEKAKDMYYEACETNIRYLESEQE